MENPWVGIKYKYPVGKRVKGKVSRRVSNGIIVEIERGVFTKIPMYELCWETQKAKSLHTC